MNLTEEEIEQIRDFNFIRGKSQEKDLNVIRKRVHDLVDDYNKYMKIYDNPPQFIGYNTWKDASDLINKLILKENNELKEKLDAQHSMETVKNG